MMLPFELDPQIIHHIIHSQAGSIGKAIIELVMNSVDANAKHISLTLSKVGFTCTDDGQGFSSKQDVLSYFGRFGTPHVEGDATYGRFRLGRGQIMAHAKTQWQSNSFRMDVDTQMMGYNYDFTESTEIVPGCSIQGEWYDSLTEAELMAALQEIRDLIRYTPAEISLNEKIITRNPEDEKWNFEDDYAYYRVNVEGAVSIYNQGVLVRHDAAHIWGAGGLIVSKQAISLNVSRTEILRKTCQVWKVIEKRFSIMADEIASQLGENRKTEARREKSARALLSGTGNIYDLADREEVITILPGNRHISLSSFFRRVRFDYSNQFCIVTNSFDIPKAETISRAKVTLFVHPQTLNRFGVYSPDQFIDCLGQINEHYKTYSVSQNWGEGELFQTQPTLLDFEPISEAYEQQMMVITEKDHLDAETRRVWTALRWCLQQYAGVCLGKNTYRDGRVAYEEDVFQILLGQSNMAEAWTDGRTYIAFNVDIVRELKKNPIPTATRIFSLLEHEIAHEGDSVDVGHDEAFYRRYHDLSVEMSQIRARYLHIWLMKYTTSLEREERKIKGAAWRERYLIDRIGNGRQKKGISTPAIDDISGDPVYLAHIPAENVQIIQTVNAELEAAGINTQGPDWSEVLAQAAHLRNDGDPELLELEEEPDWDEIHQENIEYTKKRTEYFAGVLTVDISELSEEIVYYLDSFESKVDVLQQAWKEICQEQEYEEVSEEESLLSTSLLEDIHPDLHQAIQEGETQWSLEHNASAAGFYNIEEYLRWRLQSCR